jgi:hypothetical protein
VHQEKHAYTILRNNFGLSIYLPLVLERDESQATTKLLIAIAIGILVFLIVDVFVDAAQSLYNGSLYGHGSSPSRLHEIVRTFDG